MAKGQVVAIAVGLAAIATWGGCDLALGLDGYRNCEGAECGDASEAASDATGCGAPSSIAVTGSLSATRSGPDPTSGYTPSTTTGTFSISADVPGFPASIGFSFNGSPATTTPYTESGSGVSCLVTVADPSVAQSGWQASHGTAMTADQGTCRLSLTSVTLVVLFPAHAVYCVHGTVDASLPATPGSGSTGVVTLHATF